jgi:hypothetical protein
MLSAIPKRIIPSFSALSRPMSVQVQGSSFKLALVQLAVTSNKENNLKHARDKVLEASNNGAKVVVLPVKLKMNIDQVIKLVKLSVLICIHVGVLQLPLRNKILS